MQPTILAIAGAVCLAIALVEAWLIVAVFSNENGPVARVIYGGKDVLRSHIDYLMVSQFLFVFYGLYRFMALALPAWVAIIIAVGSLFIRSPFSCAP